MQSESPRQIEMKTIPFIDQLRVKAAEFGASMVAACLAVSATHAAERTRQMDDGVIPDSYIVRFAANPNGPPVIVPPDPKGIDGRNPPPPFGEHSTGQDKAALAATLGVDACVVAILESIGAAHFLMSAAEAEKLRRHPLVTAVSPVRATTLFTGEQATGPAMRSIENPTYDNRHTLTIPSIDSFGQVGMFQDVRFCLQNGARNTWLLTGASTLGSPTLDRLPIHRVEVVKTASFPTAVYLRASATYTRCHGAPARIAQRLVGTRFEVSIGVPSGDAATRPCTTDIKHFNKTVTLPVYGLAAGTYTYDVNGVTGSFTLEAANKFPDERDIVAPY